MGQLRWVSERVASMGPIMLKTNYDHLNAVQKGSFGEAYAKMAFTLEGFEVYSAEYDDRGIDFVVRNVQGRFFLVQVKLTDLSSNPFIKEAKFSASDGFIFCAVRILNGELPTIYLARGSEWAAGWKHLHYNKDGGRSGAYYEMRFAAKYAEYLQIHEFHRYIETMRA